MVTTPVALEKQRKGDEGVRQEMIFGVVEGIGNTEGQVFMREITTQTDPPQKARCLKRKMKVPFS